MLDRHIDSLKWAKVGISSLYLVHVYEWRWGEMIYGLDDSKRGCSPSSCLWWPSVPGSVLQRLLRSMKIYNNREWDEMEDGVVDKKLIPVFGEKPARGLPKPPPPPRTAPESGDFYTWRKRQIESPSAKSGRPIETPDEGKGGKFRVS